MTTELTTRERMQRMVEHRDADRAPIIDLPWASTIERWHSEGLPEGVAWEEYLGADVMRNILPDNSPRYPVTVLEENDEYRVFTTEWGATKKDWRHTGALGYLDYRVTTPGAWRTAKERTAPSRDRVDWARLQREYPRWRQQGAWVNGVLWFGFEVTYSHMVGVPLFTAMIEEPEWVVDMVNTMLDGSIALLEMVLDAGYTLDGILWYNDMGFKGSQFMSRRMYRELFQPADRRAAAWAHGKGLPVYYHSCGNITPFVPELIDAGVDMLNPLEVKAGVDPLALKAQYGDRLAFHGGLNALLYDPPEQMWAEMERIIPVMKENGGYVIGTDHSVPDSVSLETFREFVRRAKHLGSYA
jgi:uroporphyrinogen decarboxylase